MATQKATRKGASSKRAAKPGDRVKQSANKIWLAGLGAFAMAEEEGGKVFKSLVKKGQEFEEVGREQLDKARNRVEKFAKEAKDRIESVTDDARERAGGTWEKVEKGWDDRTARTLKKLGVPTRSEIARLTKRIEELTHLVEKKAGAGTAPKKRAARRPAAKKATPGRAPARRKAG